MRSRSHAYASIARTSTRAVSLPLFKRCGGIPFSSQRRGKHSLQQAQLLRRSISARTCSALQDIVDRSQEGRPLVFHSSSNDPYHNLSIEDYLLRKSHPTSRILLFYTNRPCVVIGRNQNPWLECNLRRLQAGLPVFQEQDGSQQDSGELGNSDRVPIDLIRRRSGGGTVFHDLGNLNYSVIVPNDKDFDRRRHAEMVVRGLNKVTTYDFSATIKVNERHDIVMQKHGQSDWLKISGSAFKLTKGRALHHGTLLFSSPNLHRISELLRSPGRDLIDAKGVESVRSKVGNLAVAETQEERKRLSTGIVEKVTHEFLTLYGSSPSEAADVKPAEASDDDCRHDVNATIADGVRELQSNDWRFGQTPRFDFNSNDFGGIRLSFHANRGVVETMSLKSTSTESGRDSEATSEKPSTLCNVRDWKRVLKQSEFREISRKASENDALLGQVAAIFPLYDS